MDGEQRCDNHPCASVVGILRQGPASQDRASSGLRGEARRRGSRAAQLYSALCPGILHMSLLEQGSSKPACWSAGS